MPRGKTLWEMLLEKFQGPVEYQFYNPLKARIGNAATIDDVTLRELQFFLREIREYRRTIGRQQFFFVDYVLLARPLGGEDAWVRLRLNPVDDPERAAGVSHQVLLLQLYEEMPYSQELHDVLNDTTKRFQVLEDGEVKEEFWRINDVSTPYKARVAVVRDVNRDQRVEKEEVERLEVEYWDYWRETPDVGGSPYTEFLFVEMDRSNGWFQMWRGREIDPHKVLLM